MAKVEKTRDGREIYRGKDGRFAGSKPTPVDAPKTSGGAARPAHAIPPNLTTKHNRNFATLNKTWGKFQTIVLSGKNPKLIAYLKKANLFKYVTQSSK